MGSWCSFPWIERAFVINLISSLFIVLLLQSVTGTKFVRVTYESGDPPSFRVPEEQGFDGIRYYTSLLEGPPYGPPVYPEYDLDNAILGDGEYEQPNRTGKFVNPFNPLGLIRGNPFCSHDNLDGMCFEILRCVALGGKIGPLCRGFTGICCRFVRSCGERSSQEIVYWSNYPRDNLPEIDFPQGKFAGLGSICDMTIVKRTQHFCGLRVEPFIQGGTSSTQQADTTQKEPLPCSESMKLTLLGLGDRLELSFCPETRSINRKRYDFDISSVDDLKITLPSASSSLGRNNVPKMDVKMTQLKCDEFTGEDLAGSPGTFGGTTGGTIGETPDPTIPSPPGSKPTVDEITGTSGTSGPSGTPAPSTAKPGTPAPPAPPSPPAPPPGKPEVSSPRPPAPPTTTEPVILEPAPPNYSACGVKGKRPRMIENFGDFENSTNKDLADAEADSDSYPVGPPRGYNNATVVARQIKWGVPTNNQSNFYYLMKNKTPSVFATRVAKGVDAYPGEFPWQAAMFTSGGFYVCGGSIISDFHILTAAHCVDGFKSSPSSIKFRLGAHRIQENEPGVTQEVRVEAIRIHPRFSSGSYLQNDIAVVRVARRIHFNSRIRPICLPPKEFSDIVGKLTTVSGWGRDENGRMKNILQHLTAQIISNAQCAEGWGTSAIGKGMICMSTVKGDSCKGDSGGPTVVEVKRGSGATYYQVGIVSFGSGSCVDPNLPGVYTRVTEYLDWVRQNMT